MDKLMNFFASILLYILPLVVSASCTTEEAELLESNVPNTSPPTSEIMNDTINIIIGDNHFTAVLESNAATNEFKKMLPLTLNLKDLNNNEKFFDFSSGLPVSASNPRTINSGDLMLWGSNTLVLFYKTFNTSYSYTRLGKIENPSGLSEALGSGDVSVKFEILED